MIAQGVNRPDVRTLILGFTAASRTAAETLLRHGQPTGSILVIARDEGQAAAAAAIGLRSEVGLEPAAATRHVGVTVVIIDIEDDASAEAWIGLVGSTAPAAQVLVRAAHPASVSRLIAAGASEAVCDASLAGKLLAETAIPERRPDNANAH